MSSSVPFLYLEEYRVPVLDDISLRIGSASARVPKLGVLISLPKPKRTRTPTPTWFRPSMPTHFF